MKEAHLKLEKLITEEQLKARTKELAKELKKQFEGKHNPHFICVLKGAFLFFSDLIREFDGDMTCDFIGCSSYGNNTTSSGEVSITLDLYNPIKDRSVVLVEDIVDSGITMQFLQQHLKSHQPHSVTTVSLLHKPAAQRVPYDIDYVGFEIENDFVVGYGLDYQNDYRHLPYIAKITNFN